MVEKSIEISVDVIISEISGELSRKAFTPVDGKAKFAFVDFEWEKKGVASDLNDQFVLFMPFKSNVYVFGGINIFDRRFISLRDRVEKKK